MWHKNWPRYVHICHDENVYISPSTLIFENFSGGVRPVRLSLNPRLLTDFVGSIIQKMFYLLWKIKSNTLMILNNFYPKIMVWPRSLGASPLSSMTFHDVIVFQCYSLYFNALLSRYTWVKYKLNNLFYMSIKFDELLSVIDNVLQKRRV